MEMSPFCFWMHALIEHDMCSIREECEVNDTYIDITQFAAIESRFAAVSQALFLHRVDFDEVTTE